MLFPNDAAEAHQAPRDCPAPLNYVNSPGNRVGRPVLPAKQLQDLGYRIVTDASGPTLALYSGVRAMLERLHATGESMADQALAIRTRQAVEDTIGMEELYRVEEATVERPPG